MHDDDERDEVTTFRDDARKRRPGDPGALVPAGDEGERDEETRDVLLGKAGA